MADVSSHVALESDSILSTTRTVKDPIHDYITFSTYIWSFIDTRQYQRLREIKQLGVSYYVWPGASHNRFEHGIGVAYLAGLLVTRLQRMQPELGITERDVRCVQLAGLCHDLGHGPWSHVWDGLFIPSILPGSKWSHEDASEMMFDDLVRSNGIDIDEDDINFIKDLIQGNVRLSEHKNPPEKKFLFDIVANKRNGIDVDKFDYIARDVRAIGDHNNFSARRLIDSARVINDEICYNIKDANQLYELCQLRFSNHKRIYSHKTARAIEYMLIDALKAAEPVMKIANLIHDPKKYVHLTDNIKARIEESDDPDLMESQEILERITNRDLYSCVDWYVGRFEHYKYFKASITPDVIVKTAKRKFSSGKSESDPMPIQEDVMNLKADHVIVDICKLHHGMQNRNPLDFIRFYSKRKFNESFNAEPGELSTLTPASFAEFHLRVFTKDKRYYGIIQNAYREVYRTSIENMPPELLSDSEGSSPPITEAPSTPQAQSPAPQPRKGSFSRTASFASLSSKTPNKFTTVPPSYAPASPTRSSMRSGPTRSLDNIPPLDSRTMGSGSHELNKAPNSSGSQAGPVSEKGPAGTEEEMTTPKKRIGSRSIGLGPAPDIKAGTRSTRKRPVEDSAAPSPEKPKAKKIR